MFTSIKVYGNRDRVIASNSGGVVSPSAKYNTKVCGKVSCCFCSSASSVASSWQCSQSRLKTAISFSPDAKSVLPLCSNWVNLEKGNSAGFEMGNNHHMAPTTTIDSAQTNGFLWGCFFDLNQTTPVTANMPIFFMIDSAGDIEIISPKQPQFSVSPMAHK